MDFYSFTLLGRLSISIAGIDLASALEPVLTLLAIGTIASVTNKQAILLVVHYSCGKNIGTLTTVAEKMINTPST